MRGIKGMIFGHNMKSAIEQLQTIAERYEQFQFAKIIERHCTRNRSWIIFDNGDIWTAVQGVPERCCGRRCNIAYIDYALPKDAELYIRCCLTAPPYTGIQYYGIPTN